MKSCNFKNYGEVEKLCTKCGYVIWIDNNNNKTHEQIINDMIKSGYDKPNCMKTDLDREIDRLNEYTYHLIQSFPTRCITVGNIETNQTVGRKGLEKTFFVRSFDTKDEAEKALEKFNNEKRNLSLHNNHDWYFKRLKFLKQKQDDSKGI